jgi:hypothetical protein
MASNLFKKVKELTLLEERKTIDNALEMHYESLCRNESSRHKFWRYLERTLKNWIKKGLIKKIRNGVHVLA